MGGTFDPIWERRYRDDPGYRSFYPWTAVVSFVFGHAPKDRPRAEVSVLELGCGTGNNLWFVAREGFGAAGIDASATAIQFAVDRFAREGLKGDLRVGDFTSALPFPDASFDLAFERAAFSFTTRRGIRRGVAEVRRVLKPGGLFQCAPYSDRDSSFHKNPDADGAVRGITAGTIRGGSQACFLGVEEVRDLFRAGWEILSMKHVEEVEMARPDRVVHGEWLVIARKTAADARE